MYMDYDGVSIRIHGTALAGLDVGDSYDPAWTSMVEIDFTYDVVGTAPGDDDLLVTTPNGADSGTLTWLDDGTVITLLNMNNSDGFSFRFGNEDDDAGHRGFPGLSGWGWLVYSTGPTPGKIDWIFTAHDICVPVLPATGACCLPDDGGGDCVVVDKQTCHDLGGTYQGDGTTCEDDDDDCDDDDLLFVVDDDGALMSQEQARKTLFESMGYTVTVIRADRSQSTYDAALSSADVVYVSSKVYSSDVDDKLRHTSVGVLNEESQLTDELGICSDGGNRDMQSTVIVDATHMITEPFGTGPVTLFDSMQRGTLMGGSLAGGLEVLGDCDGDPCLAVIDPGSALDGGGTAAGRRVQLPWGGGHSFDIGSLTADGETMMRRALAWAASGPSGPPSPEPPTGDVTGDGIVDFEDLVRVLNAWGTCADCPEDFDGNGVVDLRDLLVILGGLE
jgi:hypothetical protein